MADPLGRGSWVRRARGSSRASSTRLSGIFDDHLSVPLSGTYTSSHSLRPAESRFSLNEQFAATRRDFEFGYDDASSMWETATTADGPQDDTVVFDRIQSSGHGRRGVVVNRSHYELLCLPESTSLSREDIYRAYHRLFMILQPGNQSRTLSPVVQSLLSSVQEAFETLIEPYRRVDYDLSAQDNVSETDERSMLDSDAASDGPVYEDGLRGAYLNLAAREAMSSTDLALRLDASPILRRGHRTWRIPSPLDLQLRQSMVLPLPTLGKSVQKLVTATEDFLQSKFPTTQSPHHKSTCATPTLTLTAGAHGFLDEPYRLVSALADRYQPPGPSIHSQRHLEQLIASRFLPLLNLTLRQELTTPQPHNPSTPLLPTTVLETDLAILPQAALTTRLAHALPLSSGSPPLDIELSLTNHPASPPSLGLALHHRLASGTTAFLTLDGGDLTLFPQKECKDFSNFSAAHTKRFAKTTLDPFRNAPTVEVGCTIRSDLGLWSGRGLTGPAERGLGVMDCEEGGSWTVSLGATGETVGGYVRYGVDWVSGLGREQRDGIREGNTRSGGVRGEVEIGASRDRELFVAVRALRRVGRFSRVGFEVGVSRANVHLSLYWSRLGRRVTVPVLLGRRGEVVFWGCALPFLGMGMLEMWDRRRGHKKKDGVRSMSREEMQGYIARRRAEADELTVVMASGVEPRQRMERQAGGLVIVSGKYSVKGAPSDEVADVTVAVAALVDGGELVIPRGLRKSRLLGFWDPAPMQTKVLTVRYLYQGKEGFVEVVGREELRLPLAGEKSR